MSADLDPDAAALLDRLRERGEPEMFDGAGDDPTAARARFAANLAETAGPAPAPPSVDLEGPVPLRVHHPAAGVSRAATLVFLHGGGWALGGGGAYDAVAARLAADTGAVVVAPDYRLAPEHPYPAAADDALAATRRIRDRTDMPIALVGDSAGASLAAGVAGALRDEGHPALAALLYYPPTDFEARYPSLRENAEGRWLTANDVRDCSRLYLAGRDPRGDALLSPLRARLDGLPPTIVATAGHDPLRDPGAAYAAALAGAGVDARLREHPALLHGFVGFTGVVPAADAAVAALHRELSGLLDA